MNDRSDSRHVAFLLGGSATLLFLAISRLPPVREWTLTPRTPFDRSEARLTALPFDVLSSAASVIPQGASVTVRSEPSEPRQNTNLHRLAVALLPGRRVYPAARWGVPQPLEEQRAEFLVIVGDKPRVPPGRLVLDLPLGSVWRKTPA